MRARFMTRMFAFALMAFTFFSIFVWLVVSVVTGIANVITGGSPNPFVVIGALFLVFFVFFGARSAGRIARPLGDLIDAAEHVERGDYTTRLRARGPREVRKLANAFNAMSARLEGSENERRRLLADVTHELRTPLTVIQGNLEALIDGVRPTDEAHLRAILEDTHVLERLIDDLRAILDDTHVLARLIDDLRTISVAEAGALALHREDTDLGELVRETVASFGSMANSASVALTAEVAGNTVASVDPIRVREVLTNILANALRYTPRGGSISVTVTPWPEKVTVAVRDSGEGIAADVLPHVFDRFTRSPESPGAGLGLAIAKSLVTAHGGTIEATSTPGQGTEIRFALPRSEAKASV
jgi:signal transduction histidine kinase